MKSTSEMIESVDWGSFDLPFDNPEWLRDELTAIDRHERLDQLAHVIESVLHQNTKSAAADSVAAVLASIAPRSERMYISLAPSVVYLIEGGAEWTLPFATTRSKRKVIAAPNLDESIQVLAGLSGQYAFGPSGPQKLCGLYCAFWLREDVEFAPLIDNTSHGPLSVAELCTVGMCIGFGEARRAEFDVRSLGSSEVAILWLLGARVDAPGDPATVRRLLRDLLAVSTDIPWFNGNLEVPLAYFALRRGEGFTDVFSAICDHLFDSTFRLLELIGYVSDSLRVHPLPSTEGSRLMDWIASFDHPEHESLGFDRLTSRLVERTRRT